MEIIKINETTVEIITPQPNKVERVNLESLKAQKDALQKQKNFITAKLEEINEQIAQTKLLGVKTREELINEVDIGK